MHGFKQSFITIYLYVCAHNRASEVHNPLKALAMVAREKKKEQQGGCKDDSRKRKLTKLEEIRLVRGLGPTVNVHVHVQSEFICIKGNLLLLFFTKEHVMISTCMFACAAVLFYDLSAVVCHEVQTHAHVHSLKGG